MFNRNWWWCMLKKSDNQHLPSKSAYLGTRFDWICFSYCAANPPPSSHQQWDITQPQMTVAGASCDWEQNGKKLHSLLFVGLKTSWTMWHQTFLSFIKKKKELFKLTRECVNVGKHKLSLILKGGRSLSNSPMAEQLSVWQCGSQRRNVMWEDDGKQSVISFHLSTRICSKFNRQMGRVSQPEPSRCTEIWISENYKALGSDLGLPTNKNLRFAQSVTACAAHPTTKLSESNTSDHGFLVP